MSTTTDVRGAITDEHVRRLRILQLALGLGVLLFAGTVLALWAMAGSVEPQPDDFFTILTYAQLAVAGVCFVAANILFRRMLSDAARTGPADEAAQKVLGAWILRLALMEGSALFGCAVAFLAMKAGVLGPDPIYWLNFIPPAAFLLFVARTFPTRDGLVEIVRDASRG